MAQKLDNVYLYPDGVTPVVHEGLTRVIDDKNKYDNGVAFLGEPKLPVEFGKIWHEGWDIPTQYAKDADGQCWMDDAHGGTLVKVEPKEVVAACDGKPFEIASIENHLGLEPSMCQCPCCGSTVHKTSVNTSILK